ncbi:hypothetical protein BH11PLA2_BH11PLA2_37640 [soil metagenome]
MADAAPAPAKKSLGKVVVGGGLGLVTGAVAMYSQAAFDRLVKPAKPLANFQVNADGLTVTCENRATGQSGFWDFGDGTALEPFDPTLQTVQHTYPKQGSYNVKLIVRNFLLDESDRSVTVEVSGATPQTLVASTNAPQVLNLKVEAIRDQVPATFRITGKLQNTDEVVWRLGDKTEHLVSPSMDIDRYVTFDSDGHFPIVLTAMSKSHQSPQVLVQAVDVKKPVQDTYEAMVFVTDTIMKADVQQHLVRVPAPLRDANGPTKGFVRTISAGPNCVIQKVDADKAMPAAVKNFKVDIAKDQKSASVSGEWAVTGDALAKIAGGSDMALPVMVTEERRMILSPGRQTVSGVMDGNQQILVKMPPRPLGSANGTRTISVDFGVSRKDGQRTRIAVGSLDAKGTWTSQPLTMGGQSYVVKAITLPDESLKIIVTAATSPIATPSGPQPLKR